MTGSPFASHGGQAGSVGSVVVGAGSVWSAPAASASTGTQVIGSSLGVPVGVPLGVPVGSPAGVPAGALGVAAGVSVGVLDGLEGSGVVA